MKIAILRNTPDARVFFRRGRQNREFYKESDIEAARDALADAGHEVRIFEADATLPDALVRAYARPDRTMPDDLFAFNLAYGVQGECRYTHVPALLELLGVPYLCSGPRGHTLALDKYLTKVLLDRAGLPTPAFRLLTSPADDLAGLEYPAVVKAQFESTSFGLRIVDDERELEEAARAIRDEFDQPALVETFVPGREVNCGLIGNAPPTALPVLEIDFGDVPDRDRIATLEAKRRRTVRHICPAELAPDLAAAVQELAVRTFVELGCRDCARVDFRIDADGRPWILEINSMAAIHPFGSYFDAAKTLGWTYPEMLQRLLDVATERYRKAERKRSRPEA
ncbi:MAG: ATP-grasp domain-containing protein [Planctomycetota bacterium]